MSWTLAQIGDHVDGEVVGDANHVITGVGTLANATSQQLSFLANSKYKKFLAGTAAGAVIVSREMAAALHTNAIVVDDPYVAYAKAATLLYPGSAPQTGVHPSAWIHPDAAIADKVSIGAQVVIEQGVCIATGVTIGPGCVIEQHVSIGADSCIKSNVTLCRDVSIGERVTLHPGVVIGADGFGIANDKGQWIKVPQVGRVIIGNDVEVGANTTIDRGAIDDTIIADGVKLDNQIQIGHNVIIGEHSVIAGCVGIAGSTRIGKYCAIGGGTGIGGHLEIVDGVQLTGMSMVTKSITEKGQYGSGFPAQPAREWRRGVAGVRRLGRLEQRLAELERRAGIVRSGQGEDTGGDPDV